MWTNIVGGLVLLVAVTYAVQFFAPRSARTNERRAGVRWDMAVLIGFLGAVLLVLSLTEAIRREVVVAWAMGDALGLIAGAVTWIVLGYRRSAPQPKNESALRATIRLVRTYGTLVLIGVVGIYLAVRVVGPVVEVFVAGAIGMMVIVIAVKILIDARQIIRTGDNRGK